MNKILFVLSALTIGGVCTSQAILSPEQRCITVTNQTTQPIALIRFKVQINDLKGSVHVNNLGVNETRIIDLSWPTKKARAQALPGEKKGKVVGTLQISLDPAQIKTIKIVKIAARDAQKKRLFRKKLISVKTQLADTNLSHADKFVITATATGVTFSPVA